MNAPQNSIPDQPGLLAIVASIPPSTAPTMVYAAQAWHEGIGQVGRSRRWSAISARRTGLNVAHHINARKGL